MYPLYGCPEKLLRVPVYAHSYFSRHFQWTFVPIDPVNVCTIEVSSFTRSWYNRGYSKNLGSPWIPPRSLFSKIFKALLFRWTVWMYRPNLKSVALPVPEIIAIAVLSGGCEHQSWGRGGRRGSGMVLFERALVSSYRPSIVTFPLSLRISEILPFCAPARHFFPPLLVSPKFPNVPLGLGGWPLG